MAATLEFGLAQTDAPFSSPVDTSIIVLMVVLLSVPIAFLLVDALRRRRDDAREAATLDAAAVTAQAAAAEAKPERAPSPSEPVGPPAPTKPVEDVPLRVAASDTVATNFLLEDVPDFIAHVPPYRRLEGPLEHRGFLQIAAGATVDGDLRVFGSLALGAGAEVRGDVDVRGNVYLGPSATVHGTIAAAGEVVMQRWSTARGLKHSTCLHLEEGAIIKGRAAALAVRYAHPAPVTPEAPAERNAVPEVVR